MEQGNARLSSGYGEGGLTQEQYNPPWRLFPQTRGQQTYHTLKSTLMISYAAFRVGQQIDSILKSISYVPLISSSDQTTIMTLRTSNNYWSKHFAKATSPGPHRKPLFDGLSTLSSKFLQYS